MTSTPEKQETANIILTVILSGLGIVMLTASFQGRQTDLIEYCFKPKESEKFCTKDKRYIMSVERWLELKKEPSRNPQSMIPNRATRLRVIEASNPNKWLYGSIGAIFLGAAYTLSKAREKRLLEFLPQYRNEVKQSWLLNKIQAITTARKVEYAANLDYQLWQFSADRAARAKQLSMLSPEEIAIFQEQAREQARLQSQASLEALTEAPEASNVEGYSDQTYSDQTNQTKSQPSLPHGSPGTIDEQIKQHAIESRSKWIDNFIKQTSLVWGNQGSGKSWFVRYLAQKKVEAKYQVIVLDPDSNPSEWRGLTSYHDWEDITTFMRWYVDEIARRYKEFSTSEMTEDEWRRQLWEKNQAISVICEEVTTYANIINDQELLNDFFMMALTKSRKQEMPVTFASHNNTQTALGNIKGLANLIARMLQLQLETEVNKKTLQPGSSGKGMIKLDGSDEWLPVVIPTMKSKISTFKRNQAASNSTNQKENSPMSTIEQEVTDFKISDGLDEPLRTIYVYAKGQSEWIKIRDIQRKGYTTLKGKNSTAIRRYLGLLSDQGFGEIREESGTVEFKAK